MSHRHERKEKVCLNCKAAIYGRYCHVCGQENVEMKEGFWHLTQHFIYDVTHFDTYFFKTVKILLFKPGFLTKEYIEGRRASYLNPIKMYVFTSAFFFLIMFSFFGGSENQSKAEKEKSLAKQKKELLKQYNTTSDSSLKKLLAVGISHIDSLDKVDDEKSDSIIDKKDTTAKYKYSTTKDATEPVEDTLHFHRNKNGEIEGEWSYRKVSTVAAYDSAQNLLPVSKRDGFVKRFFLRRVNRVNEKFEGDNDAFNDALLEGAKHSIPQIMFLSLPFAGFILFLLYARNNKFYFINHAIFIVHVYIATYILILISCFIELLGDKSGWNVFYWLLGISIIAIFFYFYKALRNYYKQGRFKTVIKYVLFLILMTFVFSFLTVLMVVNSLMHIS